MNNSIIFSLILLSNRLVGSCASGTSASNAQDMKPGQVNYLWFLKSKLEKYKNKLLHLLGFVFTIILFVEKLQYFRWQRRSSGITTMNTCSWEDLSVPGLHQPNFYSTTHLWNISKCQPSFLSVSYQNISLFSSLDIF